MVCNHMPDQPLFWSSSHSIRVRAGKQIFVNFWFYCCLLNSEHLTSISNNESADLQRAEWKQTCHPMLTEAFVVVDVMKWRVCICSMYKFLFWGDGFLGLNWGAMIHSFKEKKRYANHTIFVIQWFNHLDLSQLKQLFLNWTKWKLLLFIYLISKKNAIRN